MVKTHSKKIVISGFMLATGIILPFLAAHGFGISGNILLPMHIPVLLCGFFCGPFLGFLCGLILPVLNSILTGMPVMYPMAIIMTFELSAYGFVTGFLYKLFRYKKSYGIIYIVLIVAMLFGRIFYGLGVWFLLLFNTNLGKISVIAAAIKGLPGIFIQLLLIPAVVMRVRNSLIKYNAFDEAVDMIKSKKATCVLVKDNKIISAESPKGIYYVIDLYEKGLLKDAYIADTIIGKAAAMIFSLGGLKGCYGRTISKSALKWLNENNINATYSELTPAIQNRKGDGICPMEETVKNIFDEEEALEALKNKVKELRGSP